MISDYNMNTTSPQHIYLNKLIINFHHGFFGVDYSKQGKFEDHIRTSDNFNLPFHRI